MNRRQRRRPDEYDLQKNSFCIPPSAPGHKHERIQDAIDESLSAVHFNANDTRSVLNAVRSGQKRRAAKKRKSAIKPDLIFTLSLVLIVALPLSLYALRSRENITSIVTTPRQTTAQPSLKTQQAVDLVSPMPVDLATAAPSAPAQEIVNAAQIGESEAIRLARECFNMHCDTTIFTFEEYEVDVSLSDGAPRQYTVTLSSIYKNGCSFTVILSADSGEILQYSTPRLATVPAFIDAQSPEIRAWYDKYGEYLFTWPQDVQAEFSRRYQGGTLRTAREGEITYEEALSAVRAPVERTAPGLFAAYYPVLYSERAAANARAYYLVYCYAQEVADALPDGEPMIVSFDASTGDILSITGNPLDDSLLIDAISAE